MTLGSKYSYNETFEYRCIWPKLSFPCSRESSFFNILYIHAFARIKKWGLFQGLMDNVHSLSEVRLGVCRWDMTDFVLTKLIHLHNTVGVTVRVKIRD